MGSARIFNLSPLGCSRQGLDDPLGLVLQLQRSAAWPLQSHPQGRDKPVTDTSAMYLPHLLLPSRHNLERPCTDPPCKPSALPSITRNMQNFSPPFLLLSSEPHDTSYQTRPKSWLPLPRYCVMRQTLNIQLAYIYKSVRGCHWPSITHRQDRSPPPGRALS